MTTLTWIDYVIMAIYVVSVLCIGFALKRSMRTSTDFFLSGRSIPAWITGLAFLSANLGALELWGWPPAVRSTASPPAISTGWARSPR